MEVVLLNKKNLSLSKSELIAIGFKSNWIEAALDAPDEVAPSRHWLSKTGEPLYDADRLKVVFARIGLNIADLSESHLSKWVKNDRPSSKPILTFDFYALAEVVLPGISKQIRSLRIAHPVLGRQTGSGAQERQLIDACLRAMIKKCFDVDVSEGETYKFLGGCSDSAIDFLGEHWSSEVIVRPARRRSYISKSVSVSSIKRFLYSMALIQNGTVLGPSDKVTDPISLLVSSPCIRFDSNRILVSDEGEKFPGEVGDTLRRKIVGLKYHLFHGDLSDVPGRNESWNEWIIFKKDDDWLLVVEGTDFNGLEKAETLVQSMTNQELCDSVCERDSEIKSSFESMDGPELFGSRSARLREIAAEVGAQNCLRLFDERVREKKYSLIKSTGLQIESVVGVTRRAIWIRTYHCVYDVITNLGPAYLYPPDAEGDAKLVLKSEPSLSKGRMVHVPDNFLPVLVSFSTDLDKLKIA